MSPVTVADRFIGVLGQVGVERIYGVVGDSLNPIVDTVCAGSCGPGNTHLLQGLYDALTAAQTPW